jgi:hypothetical protein
VLLHLPPGLAGRAFGDFPGGELVLDDVPDVPALAPAALPLGLPAAVFPVDNFQPAEFPSSPIFTVDDKVRGDNCEWKLAINGRVYKSPSVPSN